MARGMPCRGIAAVAAGVAVPDHWRAEAVAQVLEVALEGRAGDLQRLEEGRQRHHLAVAQLLFDLVEAFAAVLGTLRTIGAVASARPNGSIARALTL